MPAGLVLTHTGVGSWNLDATGDTVGGVTPVSITGVNLHSSDSSGCDFDYTGSIDGSYTNGLNNSTGTPTLPGTSSTLTISNASFLCGFFGYQNGHSASLQATYQVAANNGTYNPIRVTSNP